MMMNMWKIFSLNIDTIFVFQKWDLKLFLCKTQICFIDNHSLPAKQSLLSKHPLSP